MGIFDSKEERDRQAGEECGKQERGFREKHAFSFPINESAGNLESAFRGEEFQAARLAAREGREYEPPEKSAPSEAKTSNDVGHSKSGNTKIYYESSYGGGGYPTGEGNASGPGILETFIIIIMILGISFGLFLGINFDIAVYKSIFGDSSRINTKQEKITDPDKEVRDLKYQIEQLQIQIDADKEATERNMELINRRSKNSSE